MRTVVLDLITENRINLTILVNHTNTKLNLYQYNLRSVLACQGDFVLKLYI